MSMFAKIAEATLRNIAVLEQNVAFLREVTKGTGRWTSVNHSGENFLVLRFFRSCFVHLERPYKDGWWERMKARRGS